MKMAKQQKNKQEIRRFVDKIEAEVDHNLPDLQKVQNCINHYIIQTKIC